MEGKLILNLYQFIGSVITENNVDSESFSTAFCDQGQIWG